jgi:glyoxylase-like metal-dependent hydrolase (beta-lactamase superfamily II)
MSVDKSLMEIGYDDYDVKEIADKIYKINEFNLSTMFVIIGEKRALAIDCGTGINDYKKVVDRLVGDKPYDLAITHGHVDHIGGMGQFDDIYISNKDIGIMDEVKLSSRKGYVQLMKFLGFKVRKNKYLDYVKYKRPNIHTIKEGKFFDLGGRTVEVFETKGHTLGSLSYLVKEDRILFSGDVVNPQALMFMKNASTIEEQVETYIRILNMDSYDTLWASHLSKPISKEVLNRGLECAKRISQKRNNFFPFICKGTFEDFVIIYRTDRRRNKNKAKVSQNTNIDTQREQL